MLAAGTLHLAAVSELAPQLTHQNAHALLAKAIFKRKTEIARLVARRFPKPDVATAVRPLADAIPAASLTAQVVANMAQSPPPVAVVPLNSREATDVRDPLPLSHAARALQQVARREHRARCERAGSPR